MEDDLNFFYVKTTSFLEDSHKNDQMEGNLIFSIDGKQLKSSAQLSECPTWLSLAVG